MAYHQLPAEKALFWLALNTIVSKNNIQTYIKNYPSNIDLSVQARWHFH